MNIIAMAFISAGYAVFYWASNQIKHWNRSVTDTEAATLKLLFGFPLDADYQTIHTIPFPFQSPTATGSNGSPANTGSGNGGANLSPTFPGGPNAVIPTPTIPGVSNV